MKELEEMEADLSSLTDEDLSVEKEIHLPVDLWIEKMLS